MSKRLTTEEFIEKARKVHGDKYDYSKVEYINGLSKVLIICPDHGEFWQRPQDHLLGQRCPKCGRLVANSKTSKSIELFINEANLVHNNKYSYDKVLYKNIDTKVTITCPIHGDFEETPYHHLRGHGCRKCSHVHQYSTGEFIKECKKVHGNKYDYAKVHYINSKTPVTIICPKHGEFTLSPMVHLTGHGCPKCKLKSLAILYNKITDLFREETILFEIGKSVIPWIDNQKFDIYFPKYLIAIEYDGEQHFRPVEYFGGQKGYDKTLERDLIKINKCKENNCHLLRIKYNYSDSDFENLITQIKEIIYEFNH